MIHYIGSSHLSLSDIQTILLEGKKIALKEEENKTLQSNFWDDSSNAQIVLKKVKFLKK